MSQPDSLTKVSGAVTGRVLPPGYLDFQVRRLREGDETALAAFYAALSERSRYYYEPYSDTSVAAMGEVVRRATAGVDLSLVATDQSGVFGHIFYRNVSEPAPHLGMGLSDAYQGLGIGSALLRYLIALGQHALGKQAISLTVMKENLRARHIYEKFGFQIVRAVSFRTLNDSYEMRLRFPEGT